MKIAGIKRYWTIDEIAKELQINKSKIRHWERQFDWLANKRTKGNQRRYTTDQFWCIKEVNDLMKFGFTTSGMINLHKRGLIATIHSYVE